MPKHEFLSVDARKFRTSNYGRLLGKPEAGTAKLSEDFCRYIDDSLEWVPTVNPPTVNPPTFNPTVANFRPGFGLNFHGPTVILPEGARIAAGVFSGWANLLRQGSARINLTVG